MKVAGEPAGAGAGGEAGLRVRGVLLAALAVGAAARLLLAFERPLWADEVFTLDLARRTTAGILAALRLDSGPPLHYLAAKLVLAPFPSPGPGDAAVRLLSVVASLLHVPLLVRIGRGCGAPRAGAVAAALFLLFPLAAVSGAEGRGYALASLLALAALERLLALREAPRTGTAALAGLLGGAAVLTHYLALLPVGGMLLSAVASGRARRQALLAGAVAAGVAASWLPVALGQPRASMAWAAQVPLPERAAHFAANLGLGIPAPPAAAWLLGPLALLPLVAVLLGRRGAARIPAAVPLLLSLVLLVPLVVFGDSALLPDRTALLLLPLVALVLAEARPPVPAAAGLAAAGVLGASIPGWLRTTPAEELATTLAPRVRAGARVVAAELWGPELEYRLAREGLAGRVTTFPSEVSAHPGWYAEEGLDPARAAVEAAAVVHGAARGTFFVFSPATRAGRALLAELSASGAVRVASAGPFEVWVATRPSTLPREGGPG